MSEPSVIVASDGVLQHPRGAGTRARILSRDVRDQKSLSLLAAIAKMSLMPAQRLEQLTPVAKRLGRIQEGARADIAVFDPVTVQDRATFRAAAEPSVGMRYVMVAGTLVVDGAWRPGSRCCGRLFQDDRKHQRGHRGNIGPAAGVD